MPYKKLGEETLITKGTLTGVISRLEDKGLVQRLASETDGRSQIIRLTEAGNDLFERTFPEHLHFINQLFNNYSPLVRIPRYLQPCFGIRYKSLLKN